MPLSLDSQRLSPKSGKHSTCAIRWKKLKRVKFARRTSSMAGPFRHATQAYIYNALCGIKFFSQLNLIPIRTRRTSVAVIILYSPKWSRHQSFLLRKTNPGNIHCFGGGLRHLYSARLRFGKENARQHQPVFVPFVKRDYRQKGKYRAILPSGGAASHPKSGRF